MKSSVKSFAILFGLVAAFSFAACKVSVNPKDDNHEYTVKFNSMGGSPVESQTVVKGQKATRPADPTKVTTNQETYYFLNWYTSTNKGQTLSSTAFSFNTPITSNITLYAKWTDTDLELPLTLEFISSGTVTVGGPWSTLKYSKNGGDLTDYAGNITVAAGDKICLYAQESENTSTRKMTISCSSDCYIYGNVMSLVTMDSQTGEWNPYVSSVESYAFYGLFRNNSHIKNHNEKKVYLPATTLSDYCYKTMFEYSTSLTTAPELPATTLASYCYLSMFYGCKGLSTAPDLPATTLADNCYYSMFQCCTNLTTAPALPAKTLADSCYLSMFKGCTNLMTAPALPAKTLADDCYLYMFYGCTSLTTAPELPATTLADHCYSQMFYGCTALTTTPELPATTLADDCYSYMFSGCTNLTTAPALPAKTLADSCYLFMFRGCTTLTTTPELPATTLADYCYFHMFDGCKNMTTAPDLPATILADYCYSHMFCGCTSLTTAPELPAITLADYCYDSMFSGCTKLNSIKCLATDISASDCTDGWVDSVSQTGTFTKNKNMTNWRSGVNGIPLGWTVKDAE